MMSGHAMHAPRDTAPDPAGPRRPRWLTSLAAGLATGALGLAALLAIPLLSRQPTTRLEERRPGMDRLGPADAPTAPVSAIARGRLIPGPGSPADLPGAWPQFRGPQRDGRPADATPLARQWGSNGPPAHWSVELGEGYAGAAVRNGRVYVLDYDQANGMDALRCLSLADGRELWRYAYPVKTKRNHGMSRTVPTVSGKYVVALGPKCHLICLDAVTGELAWGLDLVETFNVEIPQWYAGECPLVDGDRVILGTGGDALVVALDLATGRTLWKSPNPHDWKMTHSSVTPLEVAGRRMYVYCGSGGVAGIAADDGSLLWETDAWSISIATVPTPVPVGDGRLFLSGGYNAGSLMLQVKESGGAFTAAPLFRLKPSEFGATQQTPILHEGHLYGIRPDGQLTCLDLEGKVRWASGGGARFGLGPFLIADGLLIALDDDGWLTVAEAAPDGYRGFAKARILTGHDAWAPLALAGGRLLARDLTRMVCVDLRGGQP